MSETNVIFNDFAQPATISSNGGATFDLLFFYGTAGFVDASPLSVNITGSVSAGVVCTLLHI